MFTLVIGGSASGKSEYAERHVMALSGGPRIYIATMERFGEEAEARIARHRALRRGRGFETVECCQNIGSLTLPENSNVLLEDLGNLVANEMFTGSGSPEGTGTPSPEGTGTPSPEGAGTPFPEEITALLPDRIAEEIEKLRAGCAHLTIVANDVFCGGKEYEGETLTYLRVLAKLSRQLAQKADRVVEVVCGRPLPVQSVSNQPLPVQSAQGQPLPIQPVLVQPTAGSGSDRAEKETKDSRTRERGKASKMIFVTGPLFAGKQEYIMKALGWDEAAFEKNAVRDVQELAALTPADSLEALADSLASKQVVIATEVGGGVVPLDPVQRREREAAGRLACLLAARADIVVRVYCGIPCLLKGERLP